jgi:hypothetical protein
VTPNTNQAVTRRRVRRNASGVVPCHRLNARWKPVGSEYPSKYAISVIESVASAVPQACDVRQASHHEPVPSMDAGRVNAN